MAHELHKGANMLEMRYAKRPLTMLVLAVGLAACGTNPPSGADAMSESFADASTSPSADAGLIDGATPDPTDAGANPDPDAAPDSVDAGPVPDTCASTGLDCGDNGSCADSPSGPACQCDTGYDGATCGECSTSYHLVGGACISTSAVGDIVDGIANDELVRQNLVGVAVGLILDNQMVYTSGYGYADWEAGTKLTKDTLIRWASISKSLTAVAAMQLVQDGHLNLDADVRTYMPSWPVKAQGTVTMRHLLSNQAGVGHYSQIPWNQSAYDPSQPYDPEKTIDVFKGGDLLFTPGSSYNYSTFGFNLASAIVDNAARDAYGSSSGYPELVAAGIAGPAGMSTLRPDYSEFQTISPRVAGYGQTCSQTITRESTTDVSYKMGGGGWMSSVEDLTRFGQSLLQKQLVSQTTLNQMWSQKTDSGGTVRGYGFGFSTNTSSPTSANARVGHTGAQQNTRTEIMLYPGAKLGIVVMTNATYADRARITRRIANAFGRSWTIGEHSMYNQLGCDAGCSSTNYFSGVWSTGTTPTVVRRGYTHSGFFQEWQQLLDLGWVASDFETYTDSSGVRRWDGVFKKQTGGAAMWRGFDHDGFTTKVSEMTAAGYRLMDLETYEQGGTRRWAGLFEPSSAGMMLERNLTTSAFNTKWTELSGAGYRLMDVETYLVDGQRRWAGLFHAGSGGYALLRNMETAAFGTERSTLHAAGYRLVDIESYTGSSGERLWAGVFRAGTHGQALNRNYNYCGITEKHEEWTGQGLELVDLEHHE